MAKRIIFVHGRAQKPCEKDLKNLWFEAVSYGLYRDFGDEGKHLFKAMDQAKQVEFVYFGDLSNAFLDMPEEDPSCRIEALDLLKRYQRDDFNEKNYAKLARHSYLDNLASLFSAPLSTLGVAGPLISAVAPDMSHYWNEETYFGSDVRNRLTPVLKNAFDQNDSILLVAHSLGSMVSYDNLWKFSHYGEYRHDYGHHKKVDMFLTLGSPLGDENVKNRLKGSSIPGFRRYPTNIRRWVNLSAQDDFISHDSKLADDFAEMQELSMLSERIQDHKIYNLYVKSGKSNPHASVGYLIHPEFSQLLFAWMSQEGTN